ncbi:MAG TPA: HEAT repeat domain-containing protein [Pirellulales bacterium]|jgi:HEAT repeat protein
MSIRRTLIVATLTVAIFCEACAFATFAQMAGRANRNVAEPKTADIVKRLKSGNVSVRRRGAEDLMVIGAKAQEVLPSVHTALTDPDVEVRVAAALCLEQIDPTNPGIVPALAGAIDQGCIANLSPAVQVLVKREPDRSDALVRQLIKLVDSNDRGMRSAAMKSLGELGPKAQAAVPALIKQLQSNEHPYKLNASQALIGIGSRDAVPALLAALQSQDPFVRGNAGIGLLEIVPVSREVGQAVLEMMKSTALESSGQSTESMILKVHAAVPTTVDQLAALLSDANVLVRFRAVNMLSHLKLEAKSAVPALMPLMKDPNAYIRGATARAIAVTGQPYSQEFVDSLLANLKDKDNSSKLLAIEYLAAVRERPEVQSALIAALLAEHDADATAALLDALDAERLYQWLQGHDLALRKKAVDICVNPFLKVEPAERVCLALLPLLADDDATVRQLVIQALGHTAHAPVPDTDPDSPFFEPKKPADAVEEDRGWVTSRLVPPLIQFLTDADAATRGQAARSLGLLGAAAKSATPQIIKLLADESPDVRRRAVVALGDFGPGAKAAARAIAHLIEQSHDSDLRADAADALDKINAPGPEVVRALLVALADNAPATRRAAAEALAMAGPAKDVAGPLIKALEDTDDRVQESAAEALGKLDIHDVSEVILPLVEALPGQANDKAAIALVRIGKNNPIVEKYLIDALETNDRDTVQSALGVLEEIGTKNATAGLLRLLGNYEDHGFDDSIASGVQSVLDSIGPEAAEVVSAFLDLNLDQSEWNSRSELWGELLREIGPDAVDQLALALRDANSRRRLMAAWALGVCGPYTTRAVSALVPVTHDTDRKCRLASIAALGVAGHDSDEAITALVDLLARAKGKYEGELADAEDDYTATVFALRDIGPRTVPALVTALRSKNGRIASGAAHALGEMSGDAFDALPEVERMLHDPDEGVRASARQVLQHLAERSRHNDPVFGEEESGRRVREVREGARRLLNEVDTNQKPQRKGR